LTEAIRKKCKLNSCNQDIGQHPTHLPYREPADYPQSSCQPDPLLDFDAAADCTWVASKIACGSVFAERIQTAQCIKLGGVPDVRARYSDARAALRRRTSIRSRVAIESGQKRSVSLWQNQDGKIGEQSPDDGSATQAHLRALVPRQQ
jgi:hypothetical protein